MPEAAPQHPSSQPSPSGTGFIGRVLNRRGVPVPGARLWVTEWRRLDAPLPEGAVVDVYNFQSDPFATHPGDPLQAVQSGTLDDVVYTCLLGGVQRGHLTLLARSSDGPPPTVEVLPDAPPDLVIPAEGGGVRREGVPQDAGDEVARGGPASDMRGVFATVAPPSPPAAPVTDCVPEDPDPPTDWTCTPSPPSYLGGCIPAVPVGGKHCKIGPARTRTRCFPAGMGVQDSKSELSEWKVHFEISLGTAATPLRYANGFEYGGKSEETETLTWTAQGGEHGLGQCMRVVRTHLVCVQEWKSKYRVVTAFAPNDNPVYDLCRTDRTQRTVCTDVIESAVVCDRTP